MDLNEVLKMYNTGNYSVCLEVFGNFPPTVTVNVSDPQGKLMLKNIDEITREVLFQNNYILCKAIVEQSGNKENWSISTNRFIKLHSKYRSLTAVALELELNVVYNALWLFWLRPVSLRYKSIHYNGILDIISKCLNKVLRFCHDPVLGQELSSSNSQSLVSLLKRASDHLMLLPAVTCMQLLDVIRMTVLVLLREGDKESISECIPFVRKVVDQQDLLKLHLNRETKRRHEEIYFKFGVTHVNSTASLEYSDSSIDAFVISGCMICAVNGEFQQAMDCLKHFIEGQANCFQFLVNYLNAYCCLHMKQYSEAKLYLSYATTSSVPFRYQTHYQLLLARLLNEQGNLKAALAQCEGVIQVKKCNLAAQLAATISQKLQLSMAQFHYLKLLVQWLKQNSTEEDVEFEGFEECCLSVLNTEYSITLLEALYMLARQLYIAGYHVKALDSYRELLELLEIEFCASAKELPCRIQVLQETALAHVKANYFKDGEQLCRKLVKDYLPCNPSPGNQDGRWESVLYCLEEDVVSMILLADILADTDKKKALEDLNRCYNIVTEARELVGARQDNKEVQTELCDWFLSRILLRKARMSSAEDAVHYFRRALIHKPGDKEVMYHYKQWSLSHPDHQSFDPGDNVQEFLADQVHNLALRHILGCSVTEEEWMTLFDQDSSQNVLESLFDDDD